MKFLAALKPGSGVKFQTRNKERILPQNVLHYRARKKRGEGAVAKRSKAGIAFEREY